MGGIIRDWKWGLIMAFAIPTKCRSTNMSGTLTARNGAEWCIQQGYKVGNRFLYNR